MKNPAQNRIIQIAITVADQRNSKTPTCILVITRRHRLASLFYYPNTVTPYTIRNMRQLGRAFKLIGMKLIKARWYGQRLML